MLPQADPAAEEEAARRAEAERLAAEERAEDEAFARARLPCDTQVTGGSLDAGVSALSPAEAALPVQLGTWQSPRFRDGAGARQAARDAEAAERAAAEEAAETTVAETERNVQKQPTHGSQAERAAAEEAERAAAEEATAN